MFTNQIQKHLFIVVTRRAKDEREVHTDACLAGCERSLFSSPTSKAAIRVAEVLSVVTMVAVAMEGAISLRIIGLNMVKRRKLVGGNLVI